MTSPTLVNPTTDRETAYRAMLADARNAPADSPGDEELRAVAMLERVGDDFSAYVADLQAEARGEAAGGLLQMHTYWLLRDGREIIGEARVRLAMPEDWLDVYGHIGYYIAPSARGQGHGRRILRLALEKARDLGLDEVMVVCATANTPSARIIAYHGGEFLRDGTCRCCGQPDRHYRIRR